MRSTKGLPRTVYVFDRQGVYIARRTLVEWIHIGDQWYGDTRGNDGQILRWPAEQLKPTDVPPHERR